MFNSRPKSKKKGEKVKQGGKRREEGEEEEGYSFPPPLERL